MYIIDIKGTTTVVLHDVVFITTVLLDYKAHVLSNIGHCGTYGVDWYDRYFTTDTLAKLNNYKSQTMGYCLNQGDVVMDASQGLHRLQ